jgi:hypothetical protein
MWPEDSKASRELLGEVSHHCTTKGLKTNISWRDRDTSVPYFSYSESVRDLGTKKSFTSSKKPEESDTNNESSSLEHESLIPGTLQHALIGALSEYWISFTSMDVSLTMTFTASSSIPLRFSSSESDPTWYLDLE